MSAGSQAQSPTAVVNGQVRDTSGAAITGAMVEVFNDATHVRYSTETNNEGIYSVPDLPPGTYHIQVSKAGFKTVIHPDISLYVQDAKAIGFALPVGSVSDTVTVEGGAPLIDTESAAVSTVVDRQFAENLPMNGRSFQTLIQLTPGVVLTTTNYNDNGQFSVNGQRAASNYWMVDGVSANIGIGVSVAGFPGNGLGGSLGAFSALGGTNSIVSVDALQEFRIQTSTYAPEFGRTPGGQISIVTRSGTNQFHGTVFDYLRNDALDANNWFNTAVTPALPKAQERQNDFGGTFSGPIPKAKTFFFFSYEGLRLRLPQTALTTVPDGGGPGQTNARQNAIPAMQPFLNAYPLPNGAEILAACDPASDPSCPSSGQKPTGAAQFNASYSNPASLDAYSIRVDQKLNKKLTLFDRYNYSPSTLNQRGGGSSLSLLSETRITTQTETAGLTWAISPTMVNDLRFNYSRTNALSHNSLDNFGGAVPLTSLPFPSAFTAQNGLLNFSIFSLQSGGFYVGQFGHNLQRQINLVDSLSVQRGSHSLKLGIDFRRLTPLFDPQAYIQGAFFRNVVSAENGNLSRSSTASGVGPTFLFRNLGIYAQDTWRIFRRLTVTYGLRWDVDFVPQTLNGPSFVAVTGFNLNDLSNLAVAATGMPLYKTTYGNWAPRFGVAYQASQSQDWQTVLRGGFGVFYDLASSETGNQIGAGNYPFGGRALSFGGTYPLSPSKAAPPPITAPNASTGVLFATDPNLELPYTLEWNVALEQGLGRQQTVSASYIGSVGRRLLQSAFILSPNQNFAQAQLVANGGDSNYQALQLQFQRRLSHGLQALASYTWSHSIDTGSAGSISVASNVLVPSNVANSNRGPSDFDIRNGISAGVTYDISTPKNNAFANAVLRGWSLENIIQARSAAPVDISDFNFFEFSGGIIADIRPDLLPGKPLYLYGSQYPGGKAFNPAAFTDPPSAPIGPGCPFGGCPARQGTLSRNFLRGFGATQWDFAVHRDFPLHESIRLQFRAEMFNVLNHPNFGQPYGGFPLGGFGVSTQALSQSLNGFGSSGAGGFSPLYQLGGPRSVQFALKLSF